MTTMAHAAEDRTARGRAARPRPSWTEPVPERLPGAPAPLAARPACRCEQRLEVRLLGPLRVVREDGTTVEGWEWKTGKTTDLLRLLALDADRPVRSQLIIDRLWPTATPSHARGSLRTAASQIRRAVRDDCLVRELGSLSLHHAWVDVVALHAHLADGSTAMRRGDAETVVELARSAELLYVDDFHAYDDDSDWARAERTALRRGWVRLLLDAAECCLAVGAPREALDRAETVVELDPTLEAAHRVLMRAHAALGDVGSALRVYERHRRQLADELGVDPSTATRDLHLRILRGQQ